MTHSCVWRDLGACVILWLVLICDITYSQKEMMFEIAQYTSKAFWSWFIQMCDVTWAYAWYYDWFTCMWHYVFTTRSYLRKRSIDFESFRLAWLIHVCDVIYTHVWYYKLLTCMTLLIHKKKSFLRLLDRLWKLSSDATPSCVWHDLSACVILWLVHICDITYSQK